MRIDGKQYGGACSCGHSHQMATQMALIEPGCSAEALQLAAECGLTGKSCAIYDRNTYVAKGLCRPAAAQEIVLDPQNLHANESSTAEVLRRLLPDAKFLIAVGSGSIHDITRFCAHQKGIPFMSMPTAASVDGFCSTVAAMTWKGYKNTMPAVAPALVVADITVIRQAPFYLARSGVADLLAKFTALAEWKIAHLVTGEFFCQRIYDIMAQATRQVYAHCTELLSGSIRSYEELMYGLIMSGLAMQMMGNSRPASGAEHHISHIIETEPVGLGVHSTALHGEKVGVGLLMASEEYHRLAGIEDIAPFVKPYQPLEDAWLRRFFGEALYPSTAQENQHDCLAAVTPEAISAHWPAIREIIQKDIPSHEVLYALFETLGCKRSLWDIEVDPSKKQLLLDTSPIIRNRLTLMRMRRMIRA